MKSCSRPDSASTAILIGTSDPSLRTPLTSRAVWADTWGTLLVAILVWHLLASAVGNQKLRPAWLATLLAWQFFVKPSYATTILAVCGYVAISAPRRSLAVLMAVGAAWLALLVAVSRYAFGTVLPFYYLQSGGFALQGAGVARNLQFAHMAWRHCVTQRTDVKNPAHRGALAPPGWCSIPRPTD